MIDIAKLQAATAPFAQFPGPPPRLEVATRQGQREMVAATLAAGLIAADHTRPATVEIAVALMREVLAAAWPAA